MHGWSDGCLQNRNRADAVCPLEMGDGFADKGAMMRMRSLLNRSLVTLGWVAVAVTIPANAWAERYAAFVIDAHSKEVLHEDMADESRYPASLTKMMTLYLLFEGIDRGEVRLQDRIVASKRAATQPPSRLGLTEGREISVEDAIKALVTKSANDVAVAVAEHLAGSEARFAARMTARARELGMSRTRFVNASGLPDTRQQTTARDIATLSQALLEDYPQFYGYFQTPSIKWGRIYAKNHNNLLGKVDGVDGIKTGYTRASGFNLASSVMRNGHRLIAVVMGGETSLSRDNQMRFLIEQSFANLEARASGTQLVSLPMERVTLDPSTGQARTEQVSLDRPRYVSGLPTGPDQGSAGGDAETLARIADALSTEEEEEGD